MERKRNGYRTDIIRHSFASACVLFCALPTFAFAQIIEGDFGGDSSVLPIVGDDISGDGTGGGFDSSRLNPLASDSLLGFFQTILDVILVFAVPIIVLFIIFAGFQYVTARGSADKINSANRALLYAVLGGVLILGANVLLAVIGETINAITG